MSTILDKVDIDVSQNAVILKKKIREASYFGIIAVFSFAAMYYMPEGSRYLGVIPGFALGMMSCILGGAFFKYKKYSTKNKANEILENGED